MQNKINFFGVCWWNIVSAIQKGSYVKSVYNDFKSRLPWVSSKVCKLVPKKMPLVGCILFATITWDIEYVVLICSSTKRL